MNGFLFDENLPRRLRFVPSLPVFHATSIGASPSDSLLWDHAKRNNLVIVTKDVDFSDRILVSEPPPWIVQLRFGNMRANEFHTFLTLLWPKVESYLPEHKLIHVYRDRIDAVSS